MIIFNGLLSSIDMKNDINGVPVFEYKTIPLSFSIRTLKNGWDVCATMKYSLFYNEKWIF